MFHVFIGRTECAEGPHLHWSARATNGKPISLDDMASISGYKIKTGANSYDEGCEAGSCTTEMNSEQIEGSCSTIFIKLESNKTYCPSVTGNYGAHIEFLIELVHQKKSRIE